VNAITEDHFRSEFGEDKVTAIKSFVNLSEKPLCAFAVKKKYLTTKDLKVIAK